jgi:hypothetical protein
MIRHLTLAITAALFCSVAHAQQGNLPTPVQKLSPYPPVVCVTPDWRPEPCEDRNASGWQCGKVKVTVSSKGNWFEGDWSTEYLITGIEKSNNRFTLRPKDELYLNGKLCTPFGEFGKIKPQTPPATTQLPEPVKCLKPDGTEEPCESRRTRLKTVLYDEPGGILADHLRRWQALAQSGDDVEIRGACISGCTMIMAYIPNDKLCFGDSASLQFHVARDSKTGEPSIETTKWMLNQYPQDIRIWIRDRGGVDKMTIVQLWTLRAAELWAMGYQKCAPEPPPVPMTHKSDAEAERQRKS